MINVGITGGIGSGKSVVARIIAQFGYPVYDCDSRAKELMNSNRKIRQKLVNLFGEEIYRDDMLNRALLAKHIFASAEQRTLVNAAVHPEVLKDYFAFSRAATSPIVFMESAILISSGFAPFMDKIIEVTAPIEVRKHRIAQRDCATKEQIMARIESQNNETSADFKPDYNVVNDDRQALLPQVTKILASLTHLK